MQDLQSKIDQLKRAGTSDREIIEKLKKEGYSAKDIYDSMSRSQDMLEDELTPPIPSEEMGSEEEEESPEVNYEERPSFISDQKFPAVQNIPQRQPIENIEEIAEAIVNEKFSELNNTFGELNLWREKTSTEIEAIKQEILRIRNQFENMQNTMIGKVESYKNTISDMNIEVKTLSKVLEKILEPFTENVKELSRITEKLKK